METTNFKADLNESQYDAVSYCNGPLLVIAGAGSGKTRVLTYKIAYLLQHDVSPYSILALTFTNKAAKEMNNRIAKICGDSCVQGLWSGTFHSIFARILRIEHDIIGFPSDFTIYDASDSKSLIKTIVKELMLDEKLYKPNVVAGRISEAKNHLILPQAYAADGSIQKRDGAEGLGQIHRIYAIYQQRLRSAGAMDFDDLLVNMFYLLRDHEDKRQKYINRFEFILVDEYQDTNMAQHRILSLLTNKDSRICVVGDDAQSIYGFRGADITNILNFKEQYPTARVVKLECNYRSTKNIVEAANCIIRNNVGQIPKKVYSAGEQGEPIEVMAAETDKVEAQKVMTNIVMLHSQRNVPYNEVAVLYRTNAQSRVIEEVLQKAAIPYRIYGGLSFYQRKEVKDVLAYCRLTVNPDDEEAFRRVINYPARGIGNTTMQKLQMAAATNGVSLWRVAESVEHYGVELNKGAKNKLLAFCELIESFRIENEVKTASDVLKTIITRSGIAVDIAKEHTQESKSRMENIDELLASVQTIEKERYDEDHSCKRIDLSDYLSTISLLSDADTKDDGKPRVTLMTVHAAKGLEFEAVFVTGLEDELFPNANARLYPKEMEEERRLFYVAVTRAKSYCFLSYARMRFRFGNMQYSEPSIFIDEIDDKYLHFQDTKRSTSSWGNGGFEQPYSQRRNSWGRNSFEAEFNAPTEDDFRSAMNGDRYDGSRNSYSGTTARGGDDYRQWGKQRRECEDYIPKRVAPRTPPSGYVRASVTRKVHGSSDTDATSATAKKTTAPVFGGLAEGVSVHHDRFGNGKVLATEGFGDSAKVQVDFGAAGVKNLLVKYAKLTIL